MRKIRRTTADDLKENCRKNADFHAEFHDQYTGGGITIGEALRRLWAHLNSDDPADNNQSEAILRGCKEISAGWSQQHMRNIGEIALALTYHYIGDYGDCTINDPIMNLIDERRPAHETMAALFAFSAEDAAGIMDQLAPGASHV